MIVTLLRSAAVLILAGCATQDCPCDRDAKDNPHLTLQLPANWGCQRQGVETVCKTSQKDRMVIYTIKERGASDTLEQYKAHLPNAKIVQINGQQWVDSTLVSSEISGYTTRYLATSDDKYAALVTLSAKSEIYVKFAEEMRPIIGSLILRR